MSVPLKTELSGAAEEESRRRCGGGGGGGGGGRCGAGCAARWGARCGRGARLRRLLPHLMLCLSLVAYAALGALMFQHIEGRAPSAAEQEFHGFLEDIVTLVQNMTESSRPQQQIVERLDTKVQEEFKSVWFQRPKRWSFFGAMFFCCTVFTTVGYGEIYPVTLPGKVMCVLYAMVGIPLMLLVTLDVGDFLAMLMSAAYVQVHGFCAGLRSRCWSLCRRRGGGGGGGGGEDGASRTLEDGTLVYGHEVVVSEPLDIRQVVRSQAQARSRAAQLQDNRQIFEKILARDNMERKGPLLRSLSCPELDRLPPPAQGFVMWDFTGLGDSMEMLDVPLLLILLVVFAYVLLGGLILPLWETDLEGFDPYYFCFITLTTIGFGDIVPSHPKYFMLTSLFIVMGMAIMSMAFKLGQTRIVSFYRQCIRVLSRGHADAIDQG